MAVYSGVPVVPACDDATIGHRLELRRRNWQQHWWENFLRLGRRGAATAAAPALEVQAHTEATFRSLSGAHGMRRSRRRDQCHRLGRPCSALACLHGS
ncbi:hypothetical protein DM860_016906 [Cuscuta australis]|uniref:Uncharacterized protein n=1 Tax=Cuscuta australis TaxID=267555 RepID=A0A328E1D2_9ASTE|nr:hypothetical protein DM860_016906 [Cuscuta australis]